MAGEADPAPEPLLLAERSPSRLATVAIDAKGLVTAWDDGATALFGYTQNETIGIALAELVIPVRMRTAHENGLRRAERDGLTPLLDTRLDMPALHRDGHEFHVEIVVTREDAGFVARMRELGEPSPVSGELYLAAKGYQRRERIEVARLATLIESMGVGILLLDEHQRVVLANSAFVELFAIGLSPEKLRGTAPRGAGGTFTSAFADRDAAEQRIEETVKRGRPTLGDEVNLVGGRVLERDYLPVILDGATLGHLWVFRDVTAQAEIRRGLEERNRMLTEVSELKTEFVRVASHELRTPLTSIATFAGMLASDEGILDPDDRQAATTAIKRNADRMQILVADLLLLAQLESGETTLSTGPIDLPVLVREACDDAGVPVRISTGPAIEGDEALLWQLLVTAVGVVSAAADPGAPVNASAIAGGNRWTIRINTETSEPATLERLLSTHLPHPDAEGEQRTGALALMLAREIATRHGGKLTSAVTPTGVTVTVALPIRA
jgi:PAS domain S-box-containing protein